MLLNYISFASGLLPVVAAIINFRNLDYTLKLIATFFLLAFLVDFSAWLYFTGHLHMTNNHPFLYLSVVVSIIFYTWIYYRSFFRQKLKNLTLIAGLGAISVCIFFAVKNSIWDYPTWGNTALSLFMILICLLFFKQLFSRQEFLHIEEQPLFWFNSGVLIYSAFNIFLYMLLGQLEQTTQNNLYNIHLVTNFITNILFTIGLSCKLHKMP